MKITTVVGQHNEFGLLTRWCSTNQLTEINNFYSNEMEFQRFQLFSALNRNKKRDKWETEIPARLFTSYGTGENVFFSSLGVRCFFLLNSQFDWRSWTRLPSPLNPIDRTLLFVAIHWLNVSLRSEHSKLQHQVEAINKHLC